MEPSYGIVLGLVLGVLWGLVKAFGNASPFIVTIAVGSVWIYGGSLMEPAPDKSWLAQNVAQLAVGWGAVMDHVWAFVDEVAS